MSKQAWNRLAAGFEQTVCDITASSEKQLAELVEKTDPNQQKTLIDAGCGIGTFSLRFGPRFGQVIAFDFASAMVRRARIRGRHLPKATWQTLPLESAGEKLGSVGDLVACLNVITSTDSELRTRQWDSLSQLVRPGGHLLVVLPSLESARHVAEQDAHAFAEMIVPDSELICRFDTEQKHYSRHELRRAITSRGLKVLNLRKIPYSWDDDGLKGTSAQQPWDWGCLSHKPLTA